MKKEGILYMLSDKHGVSQVFDLGQEAVAISECGSTVSEHFQPRFEQKVSWVKVNQISKAKGVAIQPFLGEYFKTEIRDNLLKEFKYGNTDVQESACEQSILCRNTIRYVVEPDSLFSVILQGERDISEEKWRKKLVDMSKVVEGLELKLVKEESSKHSYQGSLEALRSTHKELSDLIDQPTFMFIWKLLTVWFMMLFSKEE